MKRYIKTEDGIYGVDKLANVKSCITYDGSKIPEEVIERANGFFIENNKLFYRDCWQTYPALPHEQVSELGLIVTESDTIEELCDEFVIKHIAISKPYVADRYQKTKILKDRQKAFLYGVEEIKGGIWTDKGLIYVAKMNEKGELELI